MYRIVLVIILFLLTISCTSRVIYDEQPIVNPASGSININTATIEELDTLPQIGRKTAEAIIQFRTDNGPFRRPEYLMQIRGISEKRFLEIRDLIKAE